jgi:SpoVK/Ycf46/Vps4 family AAA+-type ATPase
MMDSSFSYLRSALQDSRYRWVILEGLGAERTGALHHFIASLFMAAPDWQLVEDSTTSDTRHGFTDSECPWIVLDASDETDKTVLQRAAKRFVHGYRNKRILILGNGLETSDLPTYLGEGIKVRAEESDQAFRHDGALLRHSRRLVPYYTLEDLVLGPKSRLKLEESIDYIRTNEFVSQQWGFRKRHSRGHGITLIFNGPSGTGKTMAAEVVAHAVNMPLYQIDLSSIVSKWVGETEKNLKSIFRAASGVKGILLFDEGDAIFGARTKVEGSQDRYSNLEVNYLLQEIESFDGVAILSTNYEKNLDSAFLRRFTFSIAFGRPDATQRRQIWRNNLPAELPLSSSVDIEALSTFGLTGGNIKNCIRSGAARAASQKRASVEHVDFLWGIKRELQKYGQPLLREQVGEAYWRHVAPEWENVPLPKFRPGVVE